METGRSHQPSVVKQPQTVDRPDLDNLKPWLKRHVTAPFAGFGDLHRKNGRPLTEREQLTATRNQLADMVRSNKAAKMDPEAIKDILVDIVTPEPEEIK